MSKRRGHVDIELGYVWKVQKKAKVSEDTISSRLRM